MMVKIWKKKRGHKMDGTMVYMDTYWLRKEFSGVCIPWRPYWFAITGIRGPGIQTIAYRDA